MTGIFLSFMNRDPIILPYYRRYAASMPGVRGTPAFSTIISPLHDFTMIPILAAEWRDYGSKIVKKQPIFRQAA
jgi:hypothetical protein